MTVETKRPGELASPPGQTDSKPPSSEPKTHSTTRAARSQRRRRQRRRLGILLVSVEMDERRRRLLAKRGFIRIGQREDKAALASGILALVDALDHAGRRP
jgi:hypothetical protein